MDLIHRLMILVAVLWCQCHCQNLERDEELLILKNLYDRQSDIIQTLQDMKMQMNSTKQEMQSGLTEVQSGLTEVQSGLGLIQGSQKGQDDKLGGLEDGMGRFENALESSQQETVSSFKSVLTAKLLESRQHLGNDWTSNQLPEIKSAITGSTSEIKNTVSGVTNGVNGIKDRINSLESTLKSSQNSAATDIKNMITETTKKIKGLMGRVYCLTESDTYKIRERCYFFSPFQWTWNGAKGYCRNHGGHLAKISTDEQFELVKDKTANSDRWIGLSDTDSEGTYKWSVDGSSHDPSSKPNWWAEGEPNNAEDKEDCVEFSGGSSKKLNDVPCGGQNTFVCEFDGSTAFY